MDLGLFLFHMLCCLSRLGLGFHAGLFPLLQWVWQGQVHPGRLQSLCRSLSLEGSAQNEEVSGGQVPRGYPKQEVPVGSGDVSEMCLTTAIRISSLPTQDRPVCSRMITFLVAIGAGTPACRQMDRGRLIVPALWQSNGKVRVVLRKPLIVLSGCASKCLPCNGR